MYLKRFLSALLIAALALVPAGPVLAQDEEQDATIADIAADDNDLSTLSAALMVGNLHDALGSDGPFTLFAPNNAAFAELPEGTLEGLIADGSLNDVLLYHVLPGTVLAEDISDGLEAEALQGNTVLFTVDGDTAFINDVEILSADIEASNGVIHVIGSVLLPPAEEAVEEEVVVEEEAVEEEVVEEEAVEEAVEEEVVEEEAVEEEVVEVAENGDTPAVTADDQTSDGTIVTVTSVTATQTGWMVIHLDADGSPGPVIGQTAVPAGSTENVIVFLEEEIAGETELWAMLHVDEGEPGVYEFPGPDVPVRVNDTIVMAAFTASAPEPTEEVVEEEVVEEVIEEEVVEEEVEEIDEVEEVDEEVEEEMAEEEVAEEEAPETLPATGSGMTGTPLAAAAAALVVLALAAVSFVSRRRLAS